MSQPDSKRVAVKEGEEERGLSEWPIVQSPEGKQVVARVAARERGSEEANYTCVCVSHDD